MKEKTVFLVKFEGGYYADKQREWNWAFTNDPDLAKQYGSKRTAEARAEYGQCLLNDGNVVVEKYIVKTILEKVQ